MKIVNNYLFFYTNYLSNWNRSDLIDPNTGLKFGTTEQCFMWYKADFFKDEQTKKALSEYGMHPATAKALGRAVNNYDDVRWETVRYGFMVYANYLKYSQNDDLRVKLMTTGDLTLVEASPVDRVWGIGYGEDADDLILSNPKFWTGLNLLGKALMDVRKLVRTT